MAIYFFDKNQTLIKIVPESATFEAIQTQELDDDSLLKDTLSVTVKGDEKLLDAEYMAVKSYAGNTQSFDMYRIVTDTTPDKSMSFTGMSLAPYELNGHILQDLRPANHSLEYTLNRVLTGTDWRLGYMDDSLSNVTTTFYYVSVKEALKELQSLVGCEFVFKVEISGQKITDKWIEVYREMGNRTKKRFNYGTNALTVVRETNKADIYTALIGRGKGEEVSSGEDNESGQAGYGRKITFEDIEWSTAKGDPLNKPKGQYYLELPQATQVYGIKNIDGTMKARIGIVDFDDEEDKNRLINLTYQQLLVSSRPKVLFKTTVANVGSTGIGDTVTIHRHDLNIHYQTRVRKVVRNKLNDNKTQIELGDAVVTPSTKRAKQNNATIKNLKQELERAQQEITETRLSADGKANNHYGQTEPERKRTGDTWYRPHPSIAGEYQMLTWNGDAWELIVDTSDTNKVERELEEVIKPKIEEMTNNISNADNKAKDALDKVNLNAELIKEHKNNLESLTGETIPAISKDIQDMREDLGEASKTAKSSLELIGIDRGSFYTKNRRLGAKSQLIPKGETVEILHNGNGFEVGKTYTLSFSAECIQEILTSDVVFEFDTLKSDIVFEFSEAKADIEFIIQNALDTLNIVHLGDSIIMGYGRDVTVPMVESDKLDADVINGGFGGTMANLHPNAEFAKISFVNLADSITTGDFSLQENMKLPELSTAQNKAYMDTVDRIKATDFNSTDALIISYGVNDWTDGTPIDNSNNPKDKETYLGALRYGIDRIKAKYPHLQIMLTQPIFWSDPNTGLTSENRRNSKGNLLPEFAQALDTLGAELGIPVAQTHYGTGMNSQNKDLYFYSYDGTHPNDAGNVLLGETIANEFIRLVDFDDLQAQPSRQISEVTFDFGENYSNIEFEFK